MPAKPVTFCERCNKNKYRSYNIALRRLLCVVPNTDASLRIYQCPGGHGWHLTKKPKRDPA